MTEATKPIDRIRELVRNDPRYPVDAYLFIFDALKYTLETIGVERHVSGRELCFGIRDRAIENFGPLACCVFKQWRITKTDDFGNLVFNLIEAGLMGKTDTDRKEDFQSVYDLEQTLSDTELHVVHVSSCGDRGD